MSFSIVLQTSNSDKRALDKNITDVATYTGVLKDKTSIINPVIRIGANLSDIAMFDQSDENVRLIEHSVEYINANYTDITEAQAAATVNMSYSHYSRQFKRIMGRSFREYINAVRISAAENLLLTTDMSVTDIALASGFATSSHFIESFKKHKK